MDERRNQARGATEWADTYGDLGNAPQAKLMQLPLHLLDPWEDANGKSQPFGDYTEEEMNELTESIRLNGVIEAICVRPRSNGRFQIIAGHNRVEGSKRAGRVNIPALVLYINDAQATILMVDSNLKRRKKIKHSEKAFAYLARMDALRELRAAGKAGAPLVPQVTADTTGAPLVPLAGKSRDLLAEQSGENREQIRRYIRLTKLVWPLLDLVDTEKLAFRAGVELSYLTEADQRLLLEVMEGWKCKAPSMAQASQLRDQAADGELTEEQILAVMVKPKAPKVDTIKLPAVRISSFFPPNTSVAQMELEICAALEAYRKSKISISD